MGDPAGVGPELVLRALADRGLRDEVQLFAFSDAAVLTACSRVTGLPSADAIVVDLKSTGKQLPTPGDQRPVIVDLHQLDPTQFKPAEVSAACGQASHAYIQAAIDAALDGRIDAVTTGPINKSALRAAGIEMPGHTEMFAERAAAQRWCMMQYSSQITCTFVTVHVGYAEVPALLTAARILDTIELTVVALRRLLMREPKIVVCGLNPHAGEGGLFGNREEEHAILPAVRSAQDLGWKVSGPIPPDTAFLPSMRAVTDAFVCMYHDQGHIPVKALAFDTAVNTTLGLKMIRTSVDHGTAYDIAWRGEATASSLFSAIRLAARLVGLPESGTHRTT